MLLEISFSSPFIQTSYIQGVQEAAATVLGNEEFLGKILALAERKDHVSQVT